MGAPACGACVATQRPLEVTAQSSRAQAAPLPRVPRGCSHGAKHPEQTRGDRVAPDAAPEQRASSAAQRSGTLAEAAATLHVQARRARSRCGARRSCFRLAQHDTRPAHSQRAAWRGAAQRVCSLRREVVQVSRAPQKRAARHVQRRWMQRLDSRRERRAPEGDSARSCAGRLFAEAHRAAYPRRRKHSSRNLQLYNRKRPWTRGCEWQLGPRARRRPAAAVDIQSTRSMRCAPLCHRPGRGEGSS